MTQVFDVPEDMLEFGGTDWYPVGEYQFQIAEVTTFPLGEDKEGNPFDGFMTSEGEQVSLQLNNFQPLGQGDAPPSELVSQFLRICTQDGDQNYITVDPSDQDFKQLAKGKRRLVAIARTLNETPSDEFVEQLTAGAHNSRQLCAEFVRWEMKRKDGTTGKGSYPKRFWAATTI